MSSRLDPATAPGLTLAGYTTPQHRTHERERETERQTHCAALLTFVTEGVILKGVRGFQGVTPGRGGGA